MLFLLKSFWLLLFIFWYLVLGCICVYKQINQKNKKTKKSTKQQNTKQTNPPKKASSLKLKINHSAETLQVSLKSRVSAPFK